MTLAALANLPDAHAIEAAANRPFLVEDEATTWAVLDGVLDLFLVRVQEGKALGSHTPLVQIGVGQIAMGLPREEDVAVLAVPGVQTRLLSVPTGSLRTLDPGEGKPGRGATPLVEAWIESLSAALLPAGAPARTYRVKAADVATLHPGSAVASAQGVVWTRVLQGALAVEGCEDRALHAEAEAVFPLAASSFLVAVEQSRAAFVPEALTTEAGWQGLSRFHGLCMAAARRRRQEAERHEAEQIARRTVHERDVVADAVTDLASLLQSRQALPARHAVHYSDALYEACRIVGQSVGLVIRRPRRSTQGIRADALWHIARASRCQIRQVSLSDRWYRRDNGPLLGHLTADRRPVALLPSSPSRYEMVDPAGGERRVVTPAVAATIDATAYVLYRSLPERPLRAVDLLVFGLRTTRSDLLTILGIGILTGIVGMVTPIATGLLINDIIPAAQRSELLDLGLALLCIAIGSACYSATRALAMLRLEGRMEGEVQAALFTRLLMVRAPFFRQFSTGDLSSRLLGINRIRQTLTAATTSTLLSGIFSVFSYLLLFYYSWKMAVVATILVGFYLLFYFGTAYLQLRQQRSILDLEGSIQGHVLQLLLGIAKLRVAGAEARAFREWSARFSQQRKLMLENKMLRVNAQAFGSAYSVLTSAVLFGFLAWSGYHLVDPGNFMAFLTAFGQFFGALTSMAGAFTTAQTIAPTIARARPILTAPLEVDETLPDPGRLQGALTVRHVSFRYDVDGPLSLDNVSLEARPGEMVAVVGPSGSGKSTLLRLLIGLEKPESGTVFYDGQNLAQVDVQAVRRQVGVVLQDGRLMPGDIFYNIVGSTLLNLDDAWEAARIAGLERDIRAMPMGMNTIVTEGAGTFSGGQRQRLMIARAVVGRPRYLFLDEATSALDAAIQEQVSGALEGVQATRIVIAHRLSTIRHADRIFVLHNGRIEQVGTFEELMSQPGLFQDLARRQMA